MADNQLKQHLFDKYAEMLSNSSTNWTSYAIKLLKEREEAKRLCGPAISSIPESWVQAFKFWGSGVTISAMGSAGLIGNLLSFLTIVTMKKRNLFNNLLLTLTFFDTIFILNGGMFFVQRAFMFKNDFYNQLFPKLIYPLAGISMTGSTYTCIAIALERYLGICHAQSDFVIRRSRYYILTIVLISIVVDAPRFFEINAVVHEGRVVDFKYSKLRINQYYITIYTLWTRMVVTAAGPLLLMVFFNCRILHYYRMNSFTFGPSSPQSMAVTPQHFQQQASVHAQMSAPHPAAFSVGSQQQAPQHPNPSSSSLQEKCLFITFLCLTCTFFLCHLPRVLMNIHELQMNQLKLTCKIKYSRRYSEPNWVLIISSVEKVLLVFNSSINFVYYCVVGKKFRQHMCKALFWWCRRCLRVVNVELPTTTLGTGETTVPDTESRVQGGTAHSTRRQVSVDFVSVNDLDMKHQILPRVRIELEEHRLTQQGFKRKFEELGSSSGSQSTLSGASVLDDPISGDEDYSGADSISGSVHSSCSICQARWKACEGSSLHEDSAEAGISSSCSMTSSKTGVMGTQQVIRAEVEIRPCSTEELASRQKTAYQALKKGSSSMSNLSIYDITINWISEGTESSRPSGRFSTMAFLSPTSATLPRTRPHRARAKEEGQPKDEAIASPDSPAKAGEPPPSGGSPPVFV